MSREHNVIYDTPHKIVGIAVVGDKLYVATEFEVIEVDPIDWHPSDDGPLSIPRHSKHHKNG